jgi:thioredoxin-like negative regulator of GroEL
LAIVLISTNRTADAISLLESAIQDDPTNIAAHFRLSNLYRRAGRAADAQRELDAFNHYQDVKNKIGSVFKQLAAPSVPQ